MEMGNGTEAYDFSLFEDRNGNISAAAQRQVKEPVKKRREPQKQAKIVEMPGVKPQSRAKRKNLKLLARVFGFLMLCGLVANLIYCRAVLTELTDEIGTAQEALAEQESVKIQLETKRSEKYTDEYISAYVRENLNMREATDSQIHYLNVYDHDVGTVVQENEETNVILKFLNQLLNGIS